MRKILFAFVLLFLGIGIVKSETVSPERAARCAGAFMKMKSQPVPVSVSNRKAPGRDAGKSPCYYVFNNPEGGWVIIAADDRVNPVIGYSDIGSFSLDDMPDNLEWWMNGVSETIEQVRVSDVEASDEARAAWRSIMNDNDVTGSDKKVLETAKWDQEWPYNEMCPVVSGENVRSSVGCCATSMAIAMRYYRWPERGNGVIGGYVTNTFNTYIPSYSIDNHTYDWDLMPLTDGNTAGWNKDEIQQVAQLMYDCGVSISIDYTDQYGSMGYTGFISNAMVNNFSYSKTIREIKRSAYPLEQWFSIIKNEIDENRVVSYGGSTKDGEGHQFICDGYDTHDSQLHINWGWGGAEDGFFTLDLKLADIYTFDVDQSAIVGITPDTCHVEMPELEDISHFYMNGNMFGLLPEGETDMRKGSSIRFETGAFYNNSLHGFSRNFKVLLLDAKGEKVRQEGWYGTIDFEDQNSYIYYLTTDATVLEVTPELTDYFKLYMEDKNGKWVPVPGNHDLFPDNDGIVCGVTPDPVIILPDDCHAGQEIELKLSLGFVPVKSVSWSVNGKTLDSPNVILEPGRNVIRAKVDYMDSTEGIIRCTVSVK